MPRQRVFDFIVPGTPEQVAQRLEGSTRYRLFTHQASILGKGQLGGRVDPQGFVVSDDTPAMIRTMRAVARGQLTARDDGTTRVHGVAGMPPWLTWWLRVAIVLAPLILAGAAVAAGIEGGIGDFSVLFAAFAAMLPVLLLSTGYQVSQSDEGVEQLVDRIESIARGHAERSEPATTREANRQRMPAAQPQ